MRRVAVVDLGTNSTRLLVADRENGRLREVDRRLEITRLGQAVDAGGLLVPDAVERVAACVERYHEAARALGAERLLAFATSATRDARNRDELLKRVEQIGFPTRLLSGAEEAELTFRGVATGQRIDAPTLVIDLGGGSTELTLGTLDHIDFTTSLDIGCVRLTERFFAHDPPEASEIAALEAAVHRLFAEQVPVSLRPARAIGVAGTVTTLATLDLGLGREDPTLVHGHPLSPEWIRSEALVLARSPVEELRRRPGILPERAPVIAAGALALATLIEAIAVSVLEVSERDILHGVAARLAGD